jgi:hypothetical protein
MLFVTNSVQQRIPCQGSSRWAWRLGDIGGQIIQTVKYADDLVLMAKEETVLQGMIDKLIVIGRCYGMKIKVKKNKSNENFKTAIPSNNCDRPKTTGKCGIF